MKCLITGATGFIGRELCPHLLARNHVLIALSKSGMPVGNLATTALDVAETEIPPQLLQSVDVVIHLAGIAHQQADQNDYEKVNVQATLSLAKQAQRAGVRNFIFLSSVKAMGWVESETPRGEASCSEIRTDYGESKYRAEDALQRQFANSAMSIVVLRPALVYGHGAKGNLQRLGKAVGWGMPRPPAIGRRSMLALSDLVALICELVEHPRTGFNVWIACGDIAYSTREIYDAMRLKYAKSDGMAWLPLPLWRLFARVLDGGRKIPGDSTFDKLFGTEVYTSAALQAAIGWRPQAELKHLVDSTIGEVGPHGTAAAAAGQSDETLR